jgi:DNA primase
MSTGNLKEVVQRIKEEVDIVDLVGRVVALKRTGATHKGLCPFHAEKTPSFNVIPSKGIFHCFGCGAGGDAINFVMRTEGLDFVGAVERLARDMGIELRRGEGGPSKDQRDSEEKEKAAILSANAEALRWFRRNLLERRNPVADAYLPERGLTPELCEKFQLGASLDDWDALKRHLMGIGFSESLLVTAGLCKRAENGRVYDAFRNRLMFPIHDLNGRPIAFGARQLVKDALAAKYLNTPESPVYKKGQHLYALNLARESIQRSGYAMLCEGYMDVIMAHAHGHSEAVASLGTALTPNQSRLLKRFAGRVYFLYDGDAAGRNAMLKGGVPLLTAGFDARVITLPSPDDPDSFLRREGGAALKPLMESAPEFFDFAIEHHEQGVDLGTLAGKAELADRMAEVVNALHNDVMREAGIQRLLARLGGLPVEALQRILKRERSAERQASQPDGEAPPMEANAEPTNRRIVRLDPLEKGLLKLMIDSPTALEIARQSLRHEWVTDPRLAGWIFYLLDNQGTVKTLLLEAEASGELPGEREILTGIMAWDLPEPSNEEAAIRELMLRLQERNLMALAREIHQSLEQRGLPEEERRRLMAILDAENRARLREASRHLRTKDMKATKARRGDAKPAR